MDEFAARFLPTRCNYAAVCRANGCNENYRKGKIMKTIAPCLFILGLVLLSCRDKSADVQRQDEPSFSAYASNCIGSTLTRSDGSETDSIFVWSFTDRLIMDFSYRANCCLDSSDFSFTRALGPDSIVSIWHTSKLLIYRTIVTWFRFDAPPAVCSIPATRSTR
jgi:hypothetical protein